MDLSSLPFLFLFLPIFLLIYWPAQKTIRLVIITVANLVFLTWGQITALYWLLAIVLTTYTSGRIIAFQKEKNPRYRTWLWITILFNIALLTFYKLNSAYGSFIFPKAGLPQGWALALSGLVVPLGLSYVTFQSISYVIDVSKGTIPEETNFINLAAFLLFFPKLLSGPLMRYKAFAPQINSLDPSVDDISGGIRRLLIGFIKRILIANQLGLVVNAAFGLPTANFAPGIAWLVLVAYTLQIYFDFAGYTDMALGLGSMIGVKLPENFNNPYIAESVSDFWRRWHISLTAWFREYVFYPLERHRFRWYGQQINIVLVFILTGLWHGFKPHFLVWGFLHGLALAIESLGFGRTLRTVWRPLRHFYTLMIVMVGWILFRSENLRFAMSFFRRLTGDVSGITFVPFSQSKPLPFIEPSFILALGVGILFSLPLHQAWKNFRIRIENGNSSFFWGLQLTEDLFWVLLFVLGLAVLLSSGFLPNIYAEF